MKPLLPVLTAPNLAQLLAGAFPDFPPDLFSIQAVLPGALHCTLRVRSSDLRPGGTIAGPTLMMLADTAAFLVILAHIGPRLDAVTTSLHMDFLRRPTAAAVFAQAELLKLGKRLAIVEVRLFHAEEGPTPPPHSACLARASVTYSLPSS